MNSKEHIENTLNKIRPLFEKAAEKIDSIKPGEKYPAVALSKDIAKEVGMSGPSLYPILKFLFDGYPEIEVRRGAQGGLYRPLVKKVTDPSSAVSPPAADLSSPTESATLDLMSDNTDQLDEILTDETTNT